jgi:hypothetical protein
MIIDRLWDVLTGIVATLFVIAFFYAIGLAVIPTRYTKANETDSVTRPGVWGGAIAVLWSWYSLQLRIPFPLSIRVLGLIALALIFIRRRNIFFGSRFKAIATQAPRFISMYSMFYVVSYIFLAPPVSDNYLPITRIFNNDIFNYFVLGKYVQDPGTPNIANFSFFDTPSMMLLFTPAILTWINAVATVFRNDTLAATMPVIFGSASLIGCSVVYLSRIAFNLSWRYALCIGTVTVSGPFFRYIVGNYFLSSLSAIFFTLLLLKDSVKFVQFDHQSRWSKFASRFAALYIVIFYSYPPLLVVAIGLQVGFCVIYLMLYRKLHPLTDSMAVIYTLKTIFQWGFGFISCLALVVIVDPWHAHQMFRFLHVIQSKSGIGWPLDLISPFGIFGFPSTITLHGPASHLIAINVSVLTLLLLGCIYLRWAKRLTSVAGMSIFLLSSLSLLFYFAYFFHDGTTYQQWKMASYLPLPLAFAFFGAIGELAGEKNSRTCISSRIVLIVTCSAIVLCNLALHFRQEPKYDEFSSIYRDLAAIDMVGGPKDLYIKMSTFSSTFFAVYFINTKTLHLLSPSYYRREDFDMRMVSISRPLFLEGMDCDVNEGNITIRGVGCLYRTPPHLEFGRQYDFNSTIPGVISTSGLGETEAWGTWNNAKSVEINMLLAPSSAGKAGVHYINLLLRPLIIGQVKSQIVQTSCGGQVFKEYAFTQQEWVSVPYTNSDFRGEGNRELAVNMTLPNAFIPNEVDSSNPEKRLLGVGFISLSISDKPLGHLLTP